MPAGLVRPPNQAIQRHLSGSLRPERDPSCGCPPGNVSHKNGAFGSSTWQNDKQFHLVDGMLCYRNGKGGISHGSYSNDYVYRDCVMIENGNCGVLDIADSRSAVDTLRFERLTVDGSPFGFYKKQSPSPGLKPLLSAAAMTNCTMPIFVEPTAVGLDVVA